MGWLISILILLIILLAHIFGNSNNTSEPNIQMC